MRSIVQLFICLGLMQAVHAQSVNWYLVGERGDDYNSNSSSWVFTDSSNYQYGSIAEHLVQNYFEHDGTDWLAFRRVEKEYGNDTLVDLEVVFEYNGNSSTWDTAQRTQYTYNASGMAMEEQVDLFENNSWIPLSKMERVPNSNATGFIFEYGYEWDVDQQGWLLYAKTTRVYNSNDEEVILVFEVFDRSSGTLNIDSTRQELQYNGNGQIIKNESYTRVNNTWILYSQDSLVYNSNNQLHIQYLATGAGAYNERRTNTYDAEGHLIVTEYDLFNVQANDYVPFNNIQYSYDNNSNLILQQRNNWSNTLNAYEGESRDRYYYKSHLDPSDLVGVEPTIEMPQFSVYPNPTTDKLTIELVNGEVGTYQLTDLQGRSVKSGHLIPATNVINLAELPQGVYIIELTEGGRSLGTRKVLVE